MKTGAVIVAAGMSSRMGEFKPMLNIGNISIAQRVIANLQQAGVKKIVVVTGYQADLLERHLSNKGIVFLRNEQYQTSQMLDSAKIGLNYLKDKCDTILFTPVDIPMFTAATVSALLASNAVLACPEHDGKTGHPVMMSASLVERILCDEGDSGLKGVFERLNIPMTHISVNDPGILRDADTPEDYALLLEYHNQQLIRPVVSLALHKEVLFLDEKMVMLLELIDETHSVRTACQRMQISYTSGWNMIKTLESQFSDPLIVRNQGGLNGSNSHLNEHGRQLVSHFRAFSRELNEQAELLYKKYFDGVIT